MCAASVWEEVVERRDLLTVECNQIFLGHRVEALDVATHVCGRPRVRRSVFQHECICKQISRSDRRREAQRNWTTVRWSFRRLRWRLSRRLTTTTQSCFQDIERASRIVVTGNCGSIR